jgi:hypothetical protein
MLKLEDVTMGKVARDRVTGVKGTVTAKCERMNGPNSVCLEGLDSTGRAFSEWVELERVEVDD